MKKITGIMLVVMLAAVLTVSAFAANAPYTAAEYFANRDITEDASNGGILQYSIVDAFLPMIEEDVGPVDPEIGDIVEFVDPDANAFDVIVKQTQKFSYGGGQLYLHYNPEVVAPMLLWDQVVYTLTGYDSFEPISGQLKTLTGNTFTPNFLFMSDLAAAYGTAGYEASRLDGETSMIPATDKAIVANRAPNYELARWPFEITAADNNWYRTKITGSYLEFNNGDGDKVFPAVADDGVMYFYNESYTGPEFDIVGAMKRNEGELRFGSVYYSGRDAAHDNETIILDAGVIVYPTALLDDTALTLDNEDAVVISANGYYDNSTADIIYTGVLTGIEDESMYITARSFVKYMDGDDEVVVYSDPIARSLAWVGDNADMK